MKSGKYVVIEGHDGTGKSTQVGVLRQKLADIGIDSIEFHEPAGSPIADAIRTIIKDGSLKRDAITNLLLFNASRHDIWENRAKPALKSGKWVIAARNYYSTLSYQGYGEGLDLDLITEITKKSTDEQYMVPDIPIILDLDDISERTHRIGSRGELEKADTFESKDAAFQSKVQNGYLDIAKSKNVPIISANQTIEQIADEIWKYVKPSIK
jgi:dTMP kinase